MRALVSSVSVSVLALLVLAAGATSAIAADDVRWSFEFRALSIIPVKDDGTLDDLAGLGDAGTHTIDMLDELTAELATVARVSDRFSLSLAFALGTIDVELDVGGAGTFALGKSDLAMVQLAGLFDVARLGDSELKLGPVLAYGSFDDVKIAGEARERGGVIGARLDDDVLFGIEARLDTPIGKGGWFFSSNVRYLSGGGDLDVFTDGDGAGPGTSGALLAASGSAEFDPLLISFGLGVRY